MFRCWWLVFGLSALMIGAGCGGGGQAIRGEKQKTHGDRTMVSHSEGLEPLWIQECPARTEHSLPFCGLAQRGANSEIACSGAYADALGKLRRAIGQKVTAKLVADGKGGYRFEIEGGGEPLTLRGVWEDQRWFEEYSGPGGHSFDCYMMLVYPRLEYENLLGMARKAARDIVKKAAELLAEGRRLMSSGRFAEAPDGLNRAMKLLAGLKEPVVSPDGSLNSTLLAEQVKADLDRARQEAAKMAKTALVALHLVVDGKTVSSGSLMRSLLVRTKQWLAARGVSCRPGGIPALQLEAVLAGDKQEAAKTAAEKGAGLLLVIDVDSSFISREDGIYFASAGGSLRLVRTSDCREVAAVDLGPEKQGHPVSRAAALNRSVEKLRDKIIEKAIGTCLSRL
ncbi:MAG TPA: hypothetical protein VM425_02665 [Myxococcota bacterium]|nr:hypothetical protein [Myxococcota bacterium]